MDGNLFKGGLAGLGTIIAFMVGNFTPLIYLLVVFEILDYVTGIIWAWHNGELSSGAAKKGFLKKILYFFLVAAAFGFDYMIYETTATLGLQFAYPAIFGVFSVCYLSSTEIISIIENLSKFGIVVPFLTSALKSFRDKLDKMNDVDEGGE